MSEGFAVLLTVFVSAIFLAYTIVPIELGCSYNPLKWRSERRRWVGAHRLKRISILEHDLGYVPCSDDDCYTCARTIFMDNGRRYVMKSSTPPSTKSLKKAKKNRRAPARKAV